MEKVYGHLIAATRRSDVCPRVKRGKMEREGMGRTETLRYDSQAVEVVIGYAVAPNLCERQEELASRWTG